MRRLVACPHCRRQVDAAGLAAGERFRCSCGALVEVPAAQPHDAAAVRCSACGAPRREGRASCSFCGADFTLHERDLDTLCPGCAARVSDRSRFCHHCGTPILPEGMAGEITDHPCPACGEDRRLRSRRLGAGEEISVLECNACAGLWVGREAFELLVRRARKASPPDSEAVRAPASSVAPLLPQKGPLYRPCPVCGVLMHRINYGRVSGVIIDLCSAHGVWFDAHELDRVLRWLREGGEARQRFLDRMEEREEERNRRVQRTLEGTEAPPLSLEPPGRQEALLDLLGGLLDLFRG
jgi:Zn-finger nucleic acid-binding protein